MKYYKLEIQQDASKQVKKKITRKDAIRLVGLAYNNPEETLDGLSTDKGLPILIQSHLIPTATLIYKQE